VFGYTNAPFRLLCQKYGAKATVVPLVNASAIVRGAKLVDAEDGERSLGVQLSGPNPEEFAKAVAIIERKFHSIKRFDINAGCPSRGTMKDGGGSVLMKKPETLAAIVKAMKKETNLPVSVKIRIFNDKTKTLHLVDEIQDAGADFITVHGRTVKQGYSGVADWDMIREVNEHSSIPVVGNGDIKSKKEGDRRVDEEYCASFMIGRAAMSNPLVFKDKTELTYEQRKKLFFEYAELCRELGKVDLHDLKSKALQFFRSIKDGAAIRHRLAQSRTVDALLKKVSEDR
jgi:tRNA-dihydrouridine synthase B